jgi:tRNA (cytosine38-C5)-methyltransferase
LKKFHIFPFDVNYKANLVYQLNFNYSPSNKSLERFYLDEYEEICKKYEDGIIMWTMSPPCQPFTSQGLQKDLLDSRTTAYQHLIRNILAETKYPPNFIFLENVKNFEVS